MPDRELEREALELSLRRGEYLAPFGDWGSTLDEALREVAVTVERAAAPGFQALFDVRGMGDVEMSWWAFGYDPPPERTTRTTSRACETETHVDDEEPLLLDEPGTSPDTATFTVDCHLREFSATRWAADVVIDGKPGRSIYWRMNASWRWQAL